MRRGIRGQDFAQPSETIDTTSAMDTYCLRGALREHWVSISQLNEHEEVGSLVAVNPP